MILFTTAGLYLIERVEPRLLRVKAAERDAAQAAVDGLALVAGGQDLEIQDSADEDYPFEILADDSLVVDWIATEILNFTAEDFEYEVLHDLGVYWYEVTQAVRKR